VTRADRCSHGGIRRTHSIPHVCFSQSCQVIDAIPTEHHHVPQALKKKKKKITSFGQPSSVRCIHTILLLTLLFFVIATVTVVLAKNAKAVANPNPCILSTNPNRLKV